MINYKKIKNEMKKIKKYFENISSEELTGKLDKMIEKSQKPTIENNIWCDGIEIVDDLFGCIDTYSSIMDFSKGQIKLQQFSQNKEGTRCQNPIQTMADAA